MEVTAQQRTLSFICLSRRRPEAKTYSEGQTWKAVFTLCCVELNRTASDNCRFSILSPKEPFFCSKEGYLAPTPALQCAYAASNAKKSKKKKSWHNTFCSANVSSSFVGFPPFLSLFSGVVFTEDKISHHFLATEQSDRALQCLQLTLLALSSPPSIWESEQSRGGWHDCL